MTLVTRLSGSSRQQKPSVGAAPLRDAWNAIVQNLGNYFNYAKPSEGISCRGY